jgi:hypothetical protein
MEAGNNDDAEIFSYHIAETARFFGQLHQQAGSSTLFIWRGPPAPAGVVRKWGGMNPVRVGLFSRLSSHILRKQFAWRNLLDFYDLSYPWHFDNLVSDGGHYGRGPDLGADFKKTSFVDDMSGQSILNAICGVGDSVSGHN